ncbi:unnamed protein product [Rhizophagus irregularis]|nr:unnamed protein product [Rhizophagus irregularis]
MKFGRSFWFLEFGWLEFEYLNLMASFSSSLCTRKLRQVFGSLNITFRWILDSGLWKRKILTTWFPDA